MKKSLSLIAVLMLCLSILPAAFAAEATGDTAEYDIPGSYVTLDSVGLKFWLPDTLKPYSFPQDIAEQRSSMGVIDLGYYISADKTAALGITVAAIYENAQITIDDVAQLLRSAGVSKMTNVTIHELPCLVYSNEVENGAVCKVITVLAGKGRVVEFAFMGLESAVYDTVSGSIQAAE